MNYLFQLLPFD